MLPSLVRVADASRDVSLGKAGRPAQWRRADHRGDAHELRERGRRALDVGRVGQRRTIRSSAEVRSVRFWRRHVAQSNAMPARPPSEKSPRSNASSSLTQQRERVGLRLIEERRRFHEVSPCRRRSSPEPNDCVAHHCRPAGRRFRAGRAQLLFSFEPRASATCRSTRIVSDRPRTRGASPTWRRTLSAACTTGWLDRSRARDHKPRSCSS